VDNLSLIVAPRVVLMPPTPYDLTVEHRPRYLYFRVSASLVDVEMATRYINEMMAIIRESLHKCVLFVREIKGVMSANHVAIITSVIANLLPSDVRFAVVDSSAAFASIRRCIDREAAQKKRQMNIFQTEQEAEAWLLSAPAE
jgi:hypothetical protein